MSEAKPFALHKTPIDTFASQLPRAARIQILRDADIFERDGKIDACLLRSEAQRFVEEVITKDLKGFTGLTFWMDKLAAACWKCEARPSVEAEIAAQDAWRPGMPVTAKTRVRGADLKVFFDEGWDANFWHDDADVQVEDEEGNWTLDPEKIVCVSRLGYAMWQGRGTPPRGAESEPVWTHFARWAEAAEPHVTLVVTAPLEQANAVREAIDTAGGRICEPEPDISVMPDLDAEADF